MNKAYSRINWQNQPSTSTALGATNLNKMDIALNSIDDRVITLDTTKLDLTTANSMVKSFSLEQSTGVITITLLDGTVTTYDTKLEKLAVNFAYDATAQQLVITLDDGTKQYVDMSALITQYEFSDSSTVGFSVDSNGKVSASVKNGSITADKLQPNYLADITTQQQTATAQAKLSKRYAVGGVETGDTTDNAKYYKEQAELFKTQAKQYRDEAQDISNVGIAGESKLGLVKGDGNVEIESDGDMWADPYKDKGTATGTFINFKNADDALAQINVKGITTAIPTNPDLPISPDNKLNLSSPLNFDLFSNNINPISPSDFSTVFMNGGTTQGITVTVNKDGTRTFNGSPTTATVTFMANSNIAHRLIRGKTYKHCKPSLNVGHKFEIERATGKTWVSSFTFDNTVISVKPYYQVVEGATASDTIYPMIVEENYAGDFVVKKEDRINIPLDMGEWNEIKDGEHVQNKYEYIADSTTPWIFHANQPSETALARFEFSRPSLYFIKLGSQLLCTHFQFLGVIGKLPSMPTTEGIVSHTSGKVINLFIKKERLIGWSDSLTSDEKVTLLKNYLTPLNVVFCYELETPIKTPLNTYLRTFKGATNIYTTATPQVELTATFKSQLWTDSYLKDKAIESKIDDKKRVNNLLSTDPTTVLSGLMGKQLKDEIDALVSKTGITDVRGTDKKPSEYPTQRTTMEFNTSIPIGIPVVWNWQCIVETNRPWTDLTGTIVQRAFGYDENNFYREYVRYSTGDDTWSGWEDNALPSWATGKYVAFDLNNYKKVGIYIYNGWDATLLNKPVINKWGTLIISNTGTTVSQTLITEDAVVYSRKYETSVGWAPWSNNDSNTIKQMTINSTYGNIVSGGYVKNGRNIIVNVRVKITTEMPSHQGHIGGVPNGITDILPLLCVTTGGVSIDGIYLAGTSIARGSNLPTGEYVISGSYISLI